MSIVADIPLAYPHSMSYMPGRLATAEVMVQKGATYLDETVPGWELRIEHPVQMWSFTRCVAGQVLGNYALLPDSVQADNTYGFRPGTQVMAPVLAKVWTRVINERRRALRH